MTEEWGPWVEHDGKGCPCFGEYVNGIYEDWQGREMEFFGIAGSKGAFSWDWKWTAEKIPGLNKYAFKITFYRIRQSGAMLMLKRIAALPESVNA